MKIKTSIKAGAKNVPPPPIETAAGTQKGREGTSL